MKPYSSPFTRRSQEGSVAVEAAVCIAFVLLPIIFFILSFGRFFWHYTVAQKALHDATLYMAKAPLSEVRSGAAEEMAKFIMERETADLDAGTKLAPWMQCGIRQNNTAVYMGFNDCDSLTTAPFAVRTNAMLTVRNPLYFLDSGGGELQFYLISTIRHAGK